jgi:radical SAM superfamily enzyme YgiQ (UPF0313 family)
LHLAILSINTDKGDVATNKEVAGGYGTVSRFGESHRSRFLSKIKAGEANCPNISLAYLNAIFTQKGHRVSYHINELPDKSTDLCLLYTSIVDWKAERNWALRVKKRGIKVGLVGPFPGTNPELFEGCYDLLIQGEPEGLGLEIAECGSFPEGIIESPIIKDLDTLPFPNWDSFPVHLYSHFPSIRAHPSLPLLSSRGCTFSCGYYCPYVSYEGNTWRGRSPENVIEEILYLQHRYSIQGFVFRDPLFTANKGRVMEIARRLSTLDRKLEWACETHLNTLNSSLIDEMADAGLRTIKVGVESSDPSVLKTSKRRNASLDRQIEIVRYCEKKGINVTAYYILGMQGDTEDSIHRTITYAKKLNTLGAQFTISTPYPGTLFYEEIKGLIYEPDFEKFDAYTPVFQHKNLSHKQLQALKDYAFRSYYFRPSWMIKYINHCLSKNLLHELQILLGR